MQRQMFFVHPSGQYGLTKSHTTSPRPPVHDSDVGEANARGAAGQQQVFQLLHRRRLLRHRAGRQAGATFSPRPAPRSSLPRHDWSVASGNPAFEAAPAVRQSAGCRNPHRSAPARSFPLSVGLRARRRTGARRRISRLMGKRHISGLPAGRVDGKPSNLRKRRDMGETPMPRHRPAGPGGPRLAPLRPAGVSCARKRHRRPSR